MTDNLLIAPSWRPRPGKAILIGSLLLALAACDEAVTMMMTSGIDTLGEAFKAAFNADPNAQPIEPDTANLSPDPTGEPFNP